MKSAMTAAGMEQSHQIPGLTERAQHETKSKGNSSAGLLQNASSIQSMLKNTTETGGVGQFSQPQRRMPSPRSGKTFKISPRPRVASKNFSPSKPHRHPGSHSGSGRSLPFGPKHGSSTPPPGPDFQQSSPLSYREPMGSTSVEEYRTFTTTQSSYVAHNPSNRHPYGHSTRQPNRGQMQKIRPHSPFAYPTRLKRPGYRPSSPALSLNRSVNSGDPDHGNGSRTASPASMYNLNRAPTPWQQVVNRSDPTLRYYPPHQIVHSNTGSTPKPAPPSVSSMATSQRLSQVAAQYPGAWPISPAATPPPLFYDYSEAFEEQTRVHRISVSIVTSPVLHAESGQNQYWERPQNTESEFLVELPSGSVTAPIVELNVFRPENRTSMSEKDYQTEENYVNTGHDIRSSQRSALSATQIRPILHSPSSSESKSSNKDEQEMVVDFQQATSGTSDVQKINGATKLKSQEATNDPVMSEDNQSSPIASTDSIDSSSHEETPDDSTAPTSGTDTTDTCPEESPGTPINRPHATVRLHRPASRTSIPREGVAVEIPEIAAPTPERSIVSFRNRERFSKILGLDEGLQELDGITALTQRRESILSHTSDPEDRLDDSSHQALPATFVVRDSIAEESQHESTVERTSRLTEKQAIPSDDVHEAKIDRSPITLPPVRDSQMPPSSLRGSPKWKTPTPNNVRLSHRKTVINAGQKIEAKSEAVFENSTIIEDHSRDTSQESSNETESEPYGDRVTQVPRTPVAIRTFTPPRDAVVSGFPFAFMPLIHAPSEDDYSVDLGSSTAVRPPSHDGDEAKERVNITPSIGNVDVKRVSTLSLDSSRPWNLDTSYPWGDEEPPKLDVVMPLRERDSLPAGEKQPKFRLRIHRASSSTASKLTKKNRSSEDTMSSVIASSVDLLKSASFRRGQKANSSVGPGDSNTSHDIIRTSPMQTRFVESFEQPSLASPAVSLMPPSPAHDVRSFFSDDSSQGRPKGSLRKRFSDFRTRNTRANSVDHVPGYDRGLLTSTFGLSRASGRSSRQSQTATVATSHRSPTRRLRWKLFSKIRSWFSQRDAEGRLWKRKKNAELHQRTAQSYRAV